MQPYLSTFQDYIDMMFIDRETTNEVTIYINLRYSPLFNFIYISNRDLAIPSSELSNLRLKINLPSADLKSLIIFAQGSSSSKKSIREDMCLTYKTKTDLQPCLQIY